MGLFNMRKKKVDPKVAERLERLEQEAEANRPPALTEVELHRILRFMAEVQISNGQIAAAQRAREEYLAQIDPEGKLKTIEFEINRASEVTQAKYEKYMKAVAEAEARLGIKLDSYTINDETGALTPNKE